LGFHKDRSTVWDFETWRNKETAIIGLGDRWDWSNCGKQKMGWSHRAMRNIIESAGRWILGCSSILQPE